EGRPIERRAGPCCCVKTRSSVSLSWRARPKGRTVCVPERHALPRGLENVVTFLLVEIAERVEQQNDGKGNSHQPKDQSTAHASISGSTTSVFTTWGGSPGSERGPNAPPAGRGCRRPL